jgi:hypothetical protein
LESPEKEPPLPDNMLLIVFGTLCAFGIFIAGICLVFAVKNAKKPEGELKMAFWSFGALAGLVFAGMSFAYFIVPILLNHWFNKSN